MPLLQSIDSALAGSISGGIAKSAVDAALARTEGALDWLRARHADGKLPLLTAVIEVNNGIQRGQRHWLGMHHIVIRGFASLRGRRCDHRFRQGCGFPPEGHCHGIELQRTILRTEDRNAAVEMPERQRIVAYEVAEAGDIQAGGSDARTQ